MEADITSQAVGLSKQYRFFNIKLFLRADIIVKSVIIILIAASIYSWAIILNKYKLFKKINKSQKNLKINFGNQNLQKLFIISLPSKHRRSNGQLFKDSMQTVIKSRSKSNLSERLNKYSRS